MDYVCGFTFLIGDHTVLDSTTTGRMLDSLVEMKRQLHINTVILAFFAWMDNPHVEEIDWRSPDTPSDDCLMALIEGAHNLDLDVFLKPMVNCRNGTWRGYISFLEPDVPCEPKWSGWFRNYTDFMGHYARLAEDMDCEMLIIGCEFVMAQHREQDWRALIHSIRYYFSGPLTLNVDKYQEDRISFWDALDVISSSGYYPENQWAKELDRIREVVLKYQKPFFFAECGCPCRSGSEKRPNDWTTTKAFNERTQTDYYRKMFRAGKGCGFLSGYAGWAWTCTTKDTIPDGEDDYGVAGRGAAREISLFYDEQQSTRFGSTDADGNKNPLTGIGRGIGRALKKTFPHRMNKAQSPYMAGVPSTFSTSSGLPSGVSSSSGNALTAAGKPKNTVQQGTQAAAGAPQNAVQQGTVVWQGGNVLTLKRCFLFWHAPFKIKKIFADGEKVVGVFSVIANNTMSKVIFTDRRIFICYRRGIMGQKASYESLSYSKVQKFTYEPTRILNIHNALAIDFAGGAKFRANFHAFRDLKRICRILSKKTT